MNKHMGVVFAGLLILNGCSGIRNVGRETQGQEIFFQTKEKLTKEEFRKYDAWSFYWSAPLSTCEDSDIRCEILNPDGTKYFGFDMECSFGESPRSDQAEKPPEIFCDRYMRFKLVSTKGQLRFLRGAEYSFAFHQKGKRGIDWNQPTKMIKAFPESPADLEVEDRTYSQEIVCRSDEPMPPQFDYLRLDWKAPKIHRNGQLDYTLTTPSGTTVAAKTNCYCISAGMAMMDEDKNFSSPQYDLKPLFGQFLLMKFAVTKGRMLFPYDSEIRAIAYQKNSEGKSSLIKTVKLRPYPPSQKMMADKPPFKTIPLKDDTNTLCGVVYCSRDPQKGGCDLFLADLTRGTRRNLTEGRLSEDGWGFQGQVGSPDGRTVIVKSFWSAYRKKSKDRVCVIDVESLKMQEVAVDGYFSSLAWSPDSSSFALVTEKSFVIIDRQTLTTRTMGQPQWRQSTWEFEQHTMCMEIAPKWSPDGRWIAAVINGKIHLLSVQDGKQEIIFEDAPKDHQSRLCWCPDGMSIGIVGQDKQLTIISLEGKILKKYTPKAEVIHDWSPNGQYIAYEAREKTWDSFRHSQLSILSVANGESRKVEMLEGESWAGTWSPDSRYLAFNGEPDGFYPSKLMIVKPDGKNPEIVQDAIQTGGGYPPSWLYSK